MAGPWRRLVRLRMISAESKRIAFVLMEPPTKKAAFR
ncbi:hypothetical protein M527_24895 [Sphingobium indicum IP26]|nr:hypothetical protein M527_24895 [Sphingobium indicum IP26]EQB06560.1 hypothetical protein L286_06385 [Sphingobium sp. HDIP04]